MTEKGDDITRENYVELIELLLEEELNSGGMVKHTDAINFLKGWFA
jgi:hypothetical protein